MTTITVSAPPPDPHPAQDEPRRSSATSAGETTATATQLLVPPGQASPTASPTSGRNRSASTVSTLPDVTFLDPERPPRLDTFHFGLRTPFLYLGFLIVCNVLIPCLLYYLIQIYTDLSDKELIGIGSAALGVSSCFDAPFRVWKLTRHRAKYGPLYYPYVADPAFEPAGKKWLPKQMPRSWWHMDFTMHTYHMGLFAMAVPLAIAPSIPLYNFFLFSLAMLAIPPMLIFALTLKVWHSLPFWMSSDPPRTPTKPAIYYFIEDIGAVDFTHGREWRKRCQARYAASPPFRTLMWNQTLFWTIGFAVFIAATAAVDWTVDLDVAFGLVLGLFFAWGLVWGLFSYMLVHRALQHELAWWQRKYAHVVVTGLVPHDEQHRRELEQRCGTPLAELEGEEGPGHAGVEPGGTSKTGGRTRGYSVHARLQPRPGSTTSAESGVTTPTSAATTAAATQGPVDPQKLAVEMGQVDTGVRVVNFTPSPVSTAATDTTDANGRIV
ncbi:hypothetical protein Rhopal_007487-T1 [Rhodotorula paludigena]|uniref:Uncharacterized protein n=1 Tax=Rhodotorula paludigena TaxID=86838 RepID=A0AAV5GYH0_9BASI|nr:hypothetical protein Rhopal_007487-T1 [Rhodotorula paludigena]